MFMLMADSSDSRLRCSGGRLSGWMSGSTFFRREDDEMRDERDGWLDDDEAGFDSRACGEEGRCDFLVGDREGPGGGVACACACACACSCCASTGNGGRSRFMVGFMGEIGGCGCDCDVCCWCGGSKSC